MIALERRALAALLWFTATLLVADEGERSAEALVVGNGTVVDLADVIEGTVRELDHLVREPAKPSQTYFSYPSAKSPIP